MGDEKTSNLIKSKDIVGYDHEGMNLLKEE